MSTEQASVVVGSSPSIGVELQQGETPEVVLDVSTYPSTVEVALEQGETVEVVLDASADSATVEISLEPSETAEVILDAPIQPSTIEVSAPGPQGPPGQDGAGFTFFLYEQYSPSTTWTINHNLGYRPTVELLDETNREIDGDVYHTTINQVVVMFNIPVAGTARLV